MNGKDFSWSRGLGIEISPLKTISARRKAVACASTPYLQETNKFDQGALRGMKSLAREK
jgi:hypothetical protein